jgi:hypothetical protein
MKQLLVTMRADTLSRDARARSLAQITDVLQAFQAKIIGVPGFSMRIAVAAADEPGLRAELERNFIVEEDYALRTFGRSTPVSATARTPGRWDQPRRHRSR